MSSYLSFFCSSSILNPSLFKPKPWAKAEIWRSKSKLSPKKAATKTKEKKTKVEIKPKTETQSKVVEETDVPEEQVELDKKADNPDVLHLMALISMDCLQIGTRLINSKRIQMTTI